MSAAGAGPLSKDEIEALTRGRSALYPPGAALVCRCGYAGTINAVSSHRTAAARSSSAKPYCAGDPWVFADMSDALIYGTEVRADLDTASEDRLLQHRTELLILNAEEPSDPDNPPKPDGGDEEIYMTSAVPKPRGRPRFDGTPPGSPRQTPPPQQQQPRQPIAEPEPLSARELRTGKPAKVKIFGTVRAEMFANYAFVREDPEWAFEGEFSDYADQIEAQFWVWYNDMKAGRLVYVLPSLVTEAA